MTRRKWLVIDERAPQPPRQPGHIEAVAKTPVMGFREDVAIRITADGDGSRVDIRSSSRYFEHDLGSNAERVSSLIDDINAAAEINVEKPAKNRARRSSLLPRARSSDRLTLERDEEKWVTVFRAHPALKYWNHVHDFGSIRSKIIVV